LGAESIGVHEGDWTGDSGIAAIAAGSPHQLPAAVVAAHDLVASGLIRGASQRGRPVPGHGRVAGWAHKPGGPRGRPSLHTVDRARVASPAMTRPVALRRDEEPAGDDDPIARIVWRESTAAPRSR